jgi:acyl-CoA-binding protein
MKTDADSAFEHAADCVSTGKVKGMTNAELLELYGLFSVARKGSPPSSGPSPYLDPRAYAKWNAWKAASALTQYVRLCESVLLIGNPILDARRR